VKLSKFYLVSITVILIIGFFGLAVSFENIREINSDYGIADLASLSDEEVVELGGMWEYYEDSLYEDILQNPDAEKQYVKVPNEWDPKEEYKGNPYGYGTYVTYLEGLDPNKYYGIFLQDASLSFRIYVNDIETISMGEVGRTKEEYTPELQSKWGAFKPDDKGNAKIVIEVANFDNFRGGLWLKPRVGEFQVLKNMAVTRSAFETALFNSMLLMGLFLLGLYAKTLNEKSTLFMGVLSLLMALRVLFTGYRVVITALPAMPWAFYNRFEYTVGYLALPIACYMTYHLNYVKQYKTMKYLFNLLIVLALMPVFTTSQLYGNYLEVFKYMVILFGIYLLYVFIVGIYRKKPGAIPNTIGYGFLIMGAVLELFVVKVPFIVGVATFVTVAIFTAVQIVTYSTYKEQKESLESEMVIDKLTSVYNRMYLEQFIENTGLEKIKNHYWYVVFIDVDNFKEINDTYGHHIGDLVLVRIADILRQSIRDTDKVFRYGGDEFIVFVSLEKTAAPTMLEDRIHDILKDPVEILGHQIKINLSIGITRYDSGKETILQAISRSDHIMYNAKNQEFK
jgi:diguanylate cyclase (GGDEF)-like protein